jgi:hypothetical protein
MDYADGMDAGRLVTQRYPAGMPVDQVTEIVFAGLQRWPQPTPRSSPRHSNMRVSPLS